LDERIFTDYNPWRTGKFEISADIVERDIHQKATGYLKEKEIIALLGMRQTGKSTLAFQLINHLLEKGVNPGDIFYFTFDDLSLRHELAESFSNFLKIVERFLGEEVKSHKGTIYIFIDEVQKLPGFLEYIKSFYDLKLPIKWVLTGSSSLELKTQLKESLAGRILLLSIIPFTEAELFKGHGMNLPAKTRIQEFLFQNADLDEKALKKSQALIMPYKQDIVKNFEEFMIFGGLPEVALTNDREKKHTLLNNYRDMYLDQDIRNLVKEDKLWVYQKVMELLAARIGDLLNYSKIASQIEVTVDTIKRYTMLLEKTFILNNLTTYSRNIRNEILKTPKVYFTDPGIRNSLLGLTDITQLEKLNQFGMVFENAIFQRLNALLPLTGKGARFYYWRTKAKEEVDIVVYTPERLLPIEIKSDKKLQTRHLKGIKSFLRKEEEKIGVVIGRYDDAEILEEGDSRIYLLPYWMI
jgi:predicted AAA+ superfamily ATPase